MENAIDAKATKIDIRLREYGSELVEVADNGSGVKKENFQALSMYKNDNVVIIFNKPM